MSRNWTLLLPILLLGSTGTLQAEPIDSPDVVYIDGQPCNRACQSYMDWSYRVLSARRYQERETSVAGPAELEIERVKPLARPRAARHAVPVTRPAPHAGNAASNSRKIAASKSAPPAPATLEIAARQATPAAVTPANKSGETGKAVSASPDDPDNLVALVLAAPEIDSLSDLNNRSIAISVKQSASSGRVSAALMAAGAAEVRFSEAEASAIERLISGEVPAAVVLASREVASLFPEVAGFRTFRVPLAQKPRP